MDENYLNAVLLLAGLAGSKVTSIPNEYCPCEQCQNWWSVQIDYDGKPLGNIKIGWRKRVINIDWSDIDIVIDLERVTKDNVTKSDYFIHAWTYGDTVNYLRDIVYLLRVYRRDNKGAANAECNTDDGRVSTKEA